MRPPVAQQRKINKPFMFDAVIPLLAASQRILLICHVAPDGDAIGSLLGLAWLLKDQSKRVLPASQDGVPKALRFLPGWSTVVRHSSEPIDLMIALDCSDRERLGTVFSAGRHGQIPLINIDHHVTNLGYGTVNLVNPRATSTAEVVHALASALGWPIGPEAAQCLLTGLVTDTRGFRTSNVTAQTLSVAQVLMEAGASLSIITEGVLERRDFDTICIWGEALAAAHVTDRIIWTAIPLSMRERCNRVEQSDSGLANFLVGADEADVAVVFSEREGGLIDVGMRSKLGLDVAQVALTLGGGGHPRAAGCTLHAPLAEAQKRVLSALRASLTQQRAVNTKVLHGALDE